MSQEIKSQGPGAEAPTGTAREPMEHRLKCHPEPFRALKDERKGFEYRENLDRDFREGDTLILQEWDPATGEYTGDEVQRPVDYLISGRFGIPAGSCIMSWYPFHIQMQAQAAPQASAPAPQPLIEDAMRFGDDVAYALGCVAAAGLMDAEQILRDKLLEWSHLPHPASPGVVDTTDGGAVEGIPFDYPAAARSIALNLSEFFDPAQPYPLAIADAARKAKAEIESLRGESAGPEWACLGCGNTNPEKYRTIRTDTPDGTEYDMACDECGSNTFAESPHEALRQVTTELDTVRAELERLKESLPASPGVVDSTDGGLEGLLAQIMVGHFDFQCAEEDSVEEAKALSKRDAARAALLSAFSSLRTERDDARANYENLLDLYTELAKLRKVERDALEEIRDTEFITSTPLIVIAQEALSTPKSPEATNE